MKFERSIELHQVPEWAAKYINYRLLKKLIRVASTSLAETGDADLAELFFTLHRNLEDVDRFYNVRLAELQRRVRVLEEQHSQTGKAVDDRNKQLLNTVLEAQDQVRKVEWFGQINRQGFVKILKKIDGKSTGVCAQEQYLQVKVLPCQFASGEQIRVLKTRLYRLATELRPDQPTEPVDAAPAVQDDATKPQTRPVSLSAEEWETIHRHLDTDSAAELAKFLNKKPGADGKSSPKLVMTIVQRAILANAHRVVTDLMTKANCLELVDDVNGRNIIHWLIIEIGKAKTGDEPQPHGPAGRTRREAGQFVVPAEPPINRDHKHNWTGKEMDRRIDKDDPGVALLALVLDSILQRGQTEALVAPDEYGRQPMHYAAEYGFHAILDALFVKIRAARLFKMGDQFSAAKWADLDGYSPVHYAVSGGHPVIVKTLLDAEGLGAEKPIELLMTASRLGFIQTIQILLDSGLSATRQDASGECALHAAARYGRADIVAVLAREAKKNDKSIDVAEHIFGWTPLFAAAVEGQIDVVEVLIEAGANLVITDKSGWTAKEQAALRGHISVMRRLAEVTLTIRSDKTDRLRDEKLTRPPAQPVKTFGHRYLKNESVILVTLGSMDVRNKTPAASLDEVSIEEARSRQLDMPLSLVVTATGATGDAAVFDLPVHAHACTEPVSFYSSDPRNARILFDIVPTYGAGAGSQKIGRAAVMVGTVKPSAGTSRMTLQADVSVPVLSPTDMSIIGTVHFNILVVTPFQHENISISEQTTYWKRINSPVLVGHRGLGKNVASRKSLQLGENTIQSFIAAASLGATYVEFDVQLTKDHVPVIYHDFLVSESGIDAPVHTLTLDQFLHLSDGSPFDRELDDRVGRATRRTDETGLAVPPRPRAYSTGSKLSIENKMRAKEMRMQHTRDFKIKGFKGNSRGNFIQAPFTTLEEMFRTLPESTGFNIEMKYPMLHESINHEMDPYAIEINAFVDTVLKMVYDRVGERQIVFSSFNPDICLLLSLKQPSIPVMFLTDSGLESVGDVRASSLQEAIRFCSRWSLLGVVSAAEPLVVCPRLVRVVKESGLVCVTYGAQNNSADNVRVQVNEGMDAVIVDNVLAIRRGLTEKS